MSSDFMALWAAFAPAGVDPILVEGFKRGLNTLQSL
jgi:molybdopterin-guanine dinucleotide biosynthesis protein